MIFQVKCNSSGAGMGTSGLVGLFGVINASSGVISTVNMVLGIVLCLFVIPAGVSLLVSELMRKKGVIKFGDMKLDD